MHSLIEMFCDVDDYCHNESNASIQLVSNDDGDQENCRNSYPIKFDLGLLWGTGSCEPFSK